MDQSEIRGILKRELTEPTGLSDGLNVDSERERGGRNDSKAGGQINWKDRVITKVGRLWAWQWRAEQELTLDVLV